MSFTKSFIGGAIGGAAVSATANVGFGRVWNWLCVIFLPIWVFVFALGANQVTVGTNAGARVWGWIFWGLTLAFTLFLGIAAAKITAPYQLTIGTIVGNWTNHVRYAGWGKKVLFLLPLVAALLTPFASWLAAIVAAGFAIAVGVIIARSILTEWAAVEKLAIRLGGALGSELLPGSLHYGNEPGTWAINPLPPAALGLLSDPNELRSRVDQFTPEFEVRYLDTATLIVGPRTGQPIAEPDAPLSASE